MCDEHCAPKRSRKDIEFLDESNLSATLADGVLTVSIPKQAKARPSEIRIGNGSEAKQLKE